MTNYQNQVSRYSSHFLSSPFNTEHTFNQPVVVLLSDVAIISSLNFNNSLHTIEHHMAENPSDEPFWHQPTTLLPPHFIPPTILDTENQFEHTKPREDAAKLVEGFVEKLIDYSKCIWPFHWTRLKWI